MTEIRLKIDGMMCSMCESHVNEAIRKSFPVKKVKSSHKKGETIILSEEDISDDELKSSLSPTGYVIISSEHKVKEKKGLF